MPWEVVDGSGPRCDRRRVQSVDPQRVNAGAHADHVDDRVERADLMEVHLLGGRCRVRWPRRARALRRPPANRRARGRAGQRRRASRGCRPSAGGRAASAASTRTPTRCDAVGGHALDEHARFRSERSDDRTQVLGGEARRSALAERRATRRGTCRRRRRSSSPGSRSRPWVLAGPRSSSAASPRGTVDARRKQAGAEAVVDVDDADAARAGVEHREQR